MALGRLGTTVPVVGHTSKDIQVAQIGTDGQKRKRKTQSQVAGRGVVDLGRVGGEYDQSTRWGGGDDKLLKELKQN